MDCTVVVTTPPILPTSHAPHITSHAPHNTSHAHQVKQSSLGGVGPAPFAPPTTSVPIFSKPKQSLVPKALGESLVPTFNRTSIFHHQPTKDLIPTYVSDTVAPPLSLPHPLLSVMSLPLQRAPPNHAPLISAREDLDHVVSIDSSISGRLVRGSGRKMYLDAGIVSGRAFHVGWGPNWTLVHSGYPIDTQVPMRPSGVSRPLVGPTDDDTIGLKFSVKWEKVDASPWLKQQLLPQQDPLVSHTLS